MLDTGYLILDAGYWILVEKAKKRAEGTISCPGEIMDTKSFHRAGRERSERRGGNQEYWNIGRMER
jgi:hypothetical protein